MEGGEPEMRKVIVVLFVATLLIMSTTVGVFAAADPSVTVVSPGASVTGNSLLISIKMTAPKTIKVFVYEEKLKSGNQLKSIDPLNTNVDKVNPDDIRSVSIIKPLTYKNTSSLKFFNKKIENVGEGLYRICVATLDAKGNIVATSNVRAVMLSKSTSATDIFQDNGGLLKWVQNFIKNIFRS